MKRILSLILSLILILGASDVLAARKKQPAAIRMTVNGINCSFDQMPVLLNDRVIVPMRGMFEMLGATVTWDVMTSEVTGELDGTTVRLKVGLYDAYVNDKKYTLDVPSQIVNGRTLIPARFVAEAFGATVNWNEEERIVEISGIGMRSQKTAQAEKMFDRMERTKLVLDEQMVFGHSSVYGGEYGEFKVKSVNDLFYGTVLESKVIKAPGTPDALRYVYKNFPEVEPLDNLSFKVIFRAKDCDYTIGYGKMNLVVKSSTGDEIYSEELRAGSTWTSYYMSIPSYGDVASIELHCGYPDQTLEISQLKVINCNQVPLEILPDNVRDFR